MTASDPQLRIPRDRTALAREAGLGRLSLPSMLGTFDTFRVGSTNRVTESTGSPLGAGPSWTGGTGRQILAAGSMAPLARAASASSGSTVALVAVRGRRRSATSAGDRWRPLWTAAWGRYGRGGERGHGQGRMDQRRRNATWEAPCDRRPGGPRPEGRGPQSPEHRPPRLDRALPSPGTGLAGRRRRGRLHPGAAAAGGQAPARLLLPTPGRPRRPAGADRHLHPLPAQG